MYTAAGPVPRGVAGARRGVRARRGAAVGRARGYNQAMSRSPLASLEPAAHALLRVVAGAMFAFHGVQKVFRVLTDHAPPVGSQLWLGGLIELTCGTAIALGLLTRWAALLASGTMAVAYVQFHWKLQLGAGLLPAVNQGELAALYAVVFLLLAARGPGPVSLDGLRGRGR